MPGGGGGTRGGDPAGPASTGLPYGSPGYWDARYAAHTTPGAFTADEWYGPAGVAAVRAAVAALALPPGAPALEVGCGVGRLADALASEFGLRLTATDISPTAIARRAAAADPASFITWAVADATALPFPPGAFSLVIDKGTCDALDCDDAGDGGTAVRAALSEAARVLSPGGALVLASCRDPAARAGLVGPLFTTAAVVEVWGGEPGRPRPPCPEAYVYTLVLK